MEVFLTYRNGCNKVHDKLATNLFVLLQWNVVHNKTRGKSMP